MRVLCVNHLGLGSASSYRQAGLAKYLSRRGDEFGFLGRSRLAATTGGPGEEEEWTAFRSRAFWREPLARSFLSNVRVYRRRAEGSSVVFVNRAYPYTAAVIKAGAAGRKLVVDMEDWDGFGGYSSYARLYNGRGALLTLAELAFPRSADLVVAVSGHLRRVMLKMGVKDSRLIQVPNGADPELFDRGVTGGRVRESLGLGARPLVMYSSTFWSFERGLHEIAMAAFREVVRQVPEVAFLMTGPGDMEVKGELERAGLDRNVVFTGYVRRREMPELMAAADVALHVISDHPFHRASSPMIVPEYMAMGKPVVAPRIGELERMLSDGAGVLVDRPEAELLARGVVGLLKDEGSRQRAGELAHRRFLEAYSYPVLARRLGGALERVLGR